MDMEAFLFARDWATRAWRLRAAVAAPKSPWPIKSAAVLGMNLEGVGFINSFGLLFVRYGSRLKMPGRTAFKLCADGFESFRRLEDKSSCQLLRHPPLKLLGGEPDGDRGFGCHNLIGVKPGKPVADNAAAAGGVRGGGPLAFDGLFGEFDEQGAPAAAQTDGHAFLTSVKAEGRAVKAIVLRVALGVEVPIVGEFDGAIEERILQMFAGHKSGGDGFAAGREGLRFEVHVKLDGDAHAVTGGLPAR
jgi:hypothetical protein